MLDLVSQVHDVVLMNVYLDLGDPGGSIFLNEGYMSQVHDVVLMNVCLDLGDPGGSGFWNEGYMGKGRGMGRSVYKQPGNKVDGSYHSKEGSK